MKTRREALVAAGLAKPGRGKFSKDALAWLDAERAKGVKFSDDEGKPVKPTGPTEDKPTTPKVADPRDTPYLFPDEYRFPEAEYRAVGTVGGKKVTYSMREACNNCHLSLTNHICETPSVLGNIVVIERRSVVSTASK